MKIKDAITTLANIQRTYGNLDIIGGYILDETPLTKICVINEEGVEIWPSLEERHNIISQPAGVFLE